MIKTAIKITIQEYRQAASLLTTFCFEYAPASGIDRGPKMETLPHPRDFMGPKWQDRVWSGDIKSGVCKMKCSALRFYATLSANRSHVYMV